MFFVEAYTWIIRSLVTHSVMVLGIVIVVLSFYFVARSLKAVLTASLLPDVITKVQFVLTMRLKGYPVIIFREIDVDLHLNTYESTLVTENYIDSHFEV